MGLGTYPFLSQVPDVRQSANYSCGATAFQAVLSYWGFDIEESELIKLLNTTSDYGTDEHDFVRVARNLGLEAYLRDNLTVEDVERSVRDGVPVIIDCQSWRGSYDDKIPWADIWEDGHYMVVLGYDDRNLYFEDPYTLGSRVYMSKGEFVDRWHNPGGEAPSYSEREYHLGIFIRGDRPAEPRPLVPID